MKDGVLAEGAEGDEGERVEEDEEDDHDVDDGGVDQTVGEDEKVEEEQGEDVAGPSRGARSEMQRQLHTIPKEGL